MINKEDAKEVLKNLRTEENADKINKYIKMLDSMNDTDMKKILEQSKIFTIDDFKKEIQRRISVRESTQFTSLNDIVSYGYSGNTIHIHLLPKDGKFLLSKDGLKIAELKLIDALENLRDIISTDDKFKDINKIYAVSGLIKRPISSLFSNLGFDVKTMKIEKAKDDEELKKFYDRFKDKKDIGRAILPTEILFSKNWEELKNERKQELQTQLKENSVKVISRDEITILEKIGEGQFADVYKNGMQAYKILKDKSDVERFYNKDELNKIVGIKSDICVFPNKILQDDDGNLLGYSMDLVEGEKLKNKIKDLPFNDLQKAFQDAEENIRKISEQGIMFDDLHDDNLMWNNKDKKIQIIDTDFFKKTDKNQEMNISKFDTSISNIIFDLIGKYGVTINEELVPFYNVYSFTREDDKRLLPSEYIMKIKNKIETDFDREFASLGEIEETLEYEQEDKENEMLEKRNNEQSKSKKNNILKQTVSKGKSFLNNAINFTKKKVKSGKINDEIKNLKEVQQEQEMCQTNDKLKE